MTTLDPRWGEPSPFHDPWILANFQARPSDVLITTAPKAGTTWMQQILYQLSTGGNPEFYSIFREVPWLELPSEDKDWRQLLAGYEQMPDPRLFKTHCTAEQAPGIGIARIILTTRDPRDCCVSFYHHLRDMTDEVIARSTLDPPETLEQHLQWWLEDGNWFRNVKSWWPLREESGVLMLRYEDLRADLAAGLRQIAEFLGWEISEVQFGQVLEYCSFPWMKSHAEKFTRQGHSNEVYFKPGGFIRKGVSGDYATHLSAEQEQRILQRAREELEPECLDFLDLPRT